MKKKYLSAYVHAIRTADGNGACGVRRTSTLRVSQQRAVVTCSACRVYMGWDPKPPSAEEKLLRAIDAEKKKPTDIVREQEAGRRACKCGWLYPRKLSINLDGSDELRRKVAGEPLTLYVGFRCPDCGEPFELTMSTDAILAERELPRLPPGPEKN